MFSVSQIKNKKTQLIALLLLPTAINCFMPDTIIVPAKAPLASGALIAVTGVGATGLVMLKSENPDHKTLGMLSLASLGVGYAVYKYINCFTLTGRYNEVKKIINAEKEKAIWQKTGLFLNRDNSPKEQVDEKEMVDDSEEKKLINFDQLLTNIPHNHFSERYKTHLFIIKNLTPSFQNIKQAEKLTDAAIEHLKLIESQNPVESKDKENILLKELETGAVIIKDILKALVEIEKDIQDPNKNHLLKGTTYHQEVEHFNNTEMNKLQTEKLNAKLKNLDQQISRFDLKFSTLFALLPIFIARPDILYSCIDFFSQLLLKIQTTIGLSA